MVILYFSPLISISENGSSLSSSHWIWGTSDLLEVVDSSILPTLFMCELQYERALYQVEYECGRDWDDSAPFILTDSSYSCSGRVDHFGLPE